MRNIAINDTVHTAKFSLFPFTGHLASHVAEDPVLLRGVTSLGKWGIVVVGGGARLEAATKVGSCVTVEGNSHIIPL